MIPDTSRIPQTFKIDRANARTNLAFGRGIHTCPGSPLARAEARISLERLLERTVGHTDLRVRPRAAGGQEPIAMCPPSSSGLVELHLETVAAEVPPS